MANFKYRDHLIVFTRYPQAGKAKTRLIPALDAEGAAELQRQMTEHTLTQIRQLIEAHPVQVEIWFARNGDRPSASTALREDQQQMQTWLGTDWIYQPQATGDLGVRMAEAFQAAFTAGVERAVTIGTDCPGLDAGLLAQAFQALQTHDLVLGPATDGGYYLIGLRQFVPDLFQGIAWSTSDVLSRTVEIAEKLGLAIAYLEPLADVDRPEDLVVWEMAQTSTSPKPDQPLISVIIPVLNESGTIQATLRRLQQIQADMPQNGQAIEVIVVDGGSHDQTVALAIAEKVRVITASAGRARQMNAGAQAAIGDILLFLHADTYLPHRAVTLIQQTLSQPGTIAGAFELQIEGKNPGLRLVEWGVKWRSHQFQLPYGDQAIFLTADRFNQIGGFPDLPIMEDFELIRCLRSQGRVAIAPAAVITSGRRWQRLGLLTTTLINQLVIAAYFLGVPPEQIARWYRIKA